MYYNTVIVLLDRSPAFLTSNDFVTSIKSSEKIAGLPSHQPFCSNDIIITSEHKKSSL